MCSVCVCVGGGGGGGVGSGGGFGVRGGVDGVGGGELNSDLLTFRYVLHG